MTNLLTDRLPHDVTIHGRRYKINTDFRLMIRLDMLLNDEVETEDKADALLSLFGILLPDLERMIVNASADEIVKAVMDFCSDERSGRHDNDGEEPEERSHSFLHDSAYIYSAFMQAYHIDLTRARLHWYQFRALLAALPHDCLFSRIVGYRTTNLSDIPEGQRDFYRKMKRQYALSPSQSEQDRNDAIAAALMNGGDLTGVL